MTHVSALTVYTIGHGNRPLEELVSLLESNAVRRLIDVRAFPGSRRHPHFSRTALEESLPAAAIHYEWQGAALGGRRRPRGDSPNVALRNASFRAYADHMRTGEFETALDGLIERAGREGVAIMCAERLPWQCHRFLIADALVTRGVGVLHVIDTKPPRQHVRNATARAEPDGRLVYDGQTQAELGL